MQITVNLIPTVAELIPALGFRARSAYVNNTTGQWFEIAGTLVPPYTGNMVIPLGSATQSPRVITRTPSGFTSSPVAGETGTVQFTDAEVPPSGGTALQSPSSAATIIAGVPVTGFSVAGTFPFVGGVPVPVGSLATDQHILLLGMQQRGVGAPPATVAVAGWTARENLGQNTGATGLRVQSFTFPVGTLPGAAVVPAGASGAGAIMIAVRAGAATYVGGGLAGSIVAGATLAIPIFAGGVASFAMLFGYTLVAPPTLSSWAPAAAILAQNIDSGIDPGDGATRFQLQVCRTATQTVVSETCTVSANFNNMLAGISITA